MGFIRTLLESALGYDVSAGDPGFIDRFPADHTNESDHPVSRLDNRHKIVEARRTFISPSIAHLSRPLKFVERFSLIDHKL